MEGIIILGHGSRKRDANEDVKIISEMVEKKVPQALVKAAFMGNGEPSLEQGIDELVKIGANKVTIAPLFLFGGNHVKRDIPEVIAGQKEKYPDVEFIYTSYLGPDPRIAEIVLDRIKEGN